MRVQRYKILSGKARKKEEIRQNGQSKQKTWLAKFAKMAR